MSKLFVGDKAVKVGGSYQASGTIVAAFKARDGSPRYVFDFDNPAGMLHIFGESNLELCTREKEDG
jgi:hypothetical protein